MIRNAATHQYRTVSDLCGLIRWCLTGTPIQNSLDDLGSLVSFLKVPVLGNAAQFRRHITQQASLTTKRGGQNPDFDNLRLLLGAVCLRRNRGILPLPPTQDCHREVRFSTHERQAYQRLGHRIREAIDVAVSGHKAKEAHQTVLEALLRMRIFCNNGDFLKDDAQPRGIPLNNLALTEPEEFGSLLQQIGEAVCHYCSCDIVSFTQSGDNGSGIVTACYHAVCGECVGRFQREPQSGESVSTSCPICHCSHQDQVSDQELLLLDLEPQPRREIILEPPNFPSKLTALCEELELCRREGKRYVATYFPLGSRPLDQV